MAFTIDTGTRFGERAARRLRDDKIAWLTTVDGKGTPQPIPVWFLWDGDRSILLYSQEMTAKLRNLRRNSRCSLHLDGNGRGGDIVVLLGEAHVSHDDPPANQVPEYVKKYEDAMDRNGWGPVVFRSRR